MKIDDRSQIRKYFTSSLAGLVMLCFSGTLLAYSSIGVCYNKGSKSLVFGVSLAPLPLAKANSNWPTGVSKLATLIDGLNKEIKSLENNLIGSDRQCNSAAISNYNNVMVSYDKKIKKQLDQLRSSSGSNLGPVMQNGSPGLKTFAITFPPMLPNPYPYPIDDDNSRLK